MEMNFEDWNEDQYQSDYKKIYILGLVFGTNGSQEWDHNTDRWLYFTPIHNDQWIETIWTDWTAVT